MEKGYPFSILPQVTPTWKRSIQSTDIDPSLRKAASTCLVCQKNDARYICPKCRLPYCSVHCYTGHNDNCSESFYQGRVNAVLGREQKEDSDNIHSILNRIHQNGDDLAEDLLWDLAESLENGTLTDKEAEGLLTTDMKSAFYQAVNSGQLTDVIRKWHPWWMPEYTAVTTADQNEPISRRTTLDDRLLSIPSFATLRPRAAPLPQLAYNMMDLLYSTALILRQYHGIENARTASIEAAQNLIEASSVLWKNAQYTSLAECLMACTHKKLSIDWKILAHDVARLWNQRDMAHTLLDAVALLKAASRDLTGCHKIQMKKYQKKIEFYLSWSRAVSLPLQLGTEIDQWIVDWSSVEKANTINLLPNNSATSLS